MTTYDLFAAQLSAWGLEVGQRERELLIDLARTLASYRRANVIGARDADVVLMEHVLDSLSCLLFRPVYEAASIVDVGSGGGLPGLPLALALPHAGLTLLEATGKKVAFLEHAIETLPVPNATAVKTRAEEAGKDKAYRSVFDVATVRAVARLSVVAEYCVPMVPVGGYVVAMKGRPGDEELEKGARAAAVLGARIREVIDVPLLPEVSDKERRLIVLEKVAETTREYPRNTGVPAKKPLGGG